MTWLDLFDGKALNRASLADLIFMTVWTMTAIGFVYLARDLEEQGAPEMSHLVFGTNLLFYRIVIALAAVSWPIWTFMFAAYTIAQAFVSSRQQTRR